MATFFQKAVEAILEAHGQLGRFHSQQEFSLRLEMDGYFPLVIERLGGNQVVVAHYRMEAHDQIPDPDVEFDYATWTPYAISTPDSYKYGLVDRGSIRVVDQAFLNDINPFLEIWAHNLHAQGWETRAKVAA